MKTLLAVSDLHYSLSQFHLHIADLKLEQGDYFVIVGKTGSGKTVLLECLAGLKKIGRGKIFLEKKDITNKPPETRQIGFAYQDSLLFPFLTVEKNILFSAKARGLERENEIMKRMKEIVNRMGIAYLLTRYPQNLSGGERQRVSLARAILLKPQLLLLDEPLSALDANTRTEMSQLLKELHLNDEMTIIHVTHDISEALQLGTKMAVLQEGQFIEMNDPFTLYTQPVKLDSAKFLGIDNLIPVSMKVHNEKILVEHADGEFLIEHKKQFLNQKQVIMGIRNIMLQIQPPQLEYHSFRAYIKTISFNGQLVLLTCKNNALWHIAVPLTKWHEKDWKIDDEISLYVAKKDILFLAGTL